MPQGCGCGGTGGGGGTPAEIMEVLKTVFDGSGCIRIDPTTGKGSLWIANTEGQALTCTGEGAYVPGDDVPPIPVTPKIECFNPADPQASTNCYIAQKNAELVTAPGSPQGLDYCTQFGFHIHGFAFATSDGVAVWGPSWRDSALSSYTTTESSAKLSSVNYSTWTGLVCDAGNSDNYVGANEKTTPARKTPAGGWYGFGVPEFNPMALTDVLARVDKKRVVICDLAGSDATTRPEDVTAVRTAILSAQAATWTQVLVSPDTAGLDAASTLSGSGLTVGVRLGTNTTLTPSQLTAAGITFAWFRLSEQTAERIAALKTAGIRWVAPTNSRHYDAAEAFAAGACAVTGSDPLYMRGHDTTKRGYQSSPLHAGYGTQTGSLTFYSDRAGHPAQYRGYRVNVTSDPGPIGPGLYWTSQDTTTDGGVRVAILLGALPTPDTSGGEAALFSVFWRQQITSLFTQPTDAGIKAGIAIGQAVDCDVTNYQVPAAITQRINMYRALMRMYNGTRSGELAMYKMTQGVTATTYPGVASPAVNAATEVRLGVQLTAGQVIFRRYNTSWGMQQQSIANDSSYRGRYVYLYVESNNESGPAANTPWEVRFWDVSYNAPPGAAFGAQSLAAEPPMTVAFDGENVTVT